MQEAGKNNVIMATIKSDKRCFSDFGSLEKDTKYKVTDIGFDCNIILVSNKSMFLLIALQGWL